MRILSPVLEFLCKLGDRGSIYNRLLCSDGLACMGLQQVGLLDDGSVVLSYGWDPGA